MTTRADEFAAAERARREAEIAARPDRPAPPPGEGWALTFSERTAVWYATRPLASHLRGARVEIAVSIQRRWRSATHITGPGWSEPFTLISMTSSVRGAYLVLEAGAELSTVIAGLQAAQRELAGGGGPR